MINKNEINQRTKNNMKKKQIITTCCVAAAILVGVFVWQAYFSATKIAFVNFQTINL